jgi:hypothetical protein
MLIVGIIMVIVAVAAVGGAYLLLSSGGSTDRGADQNGPGGNDQVGDGDTILPYQLHDGDYIVYTTTTSSMGRDLTGTIKWLVSNVTSSGYYVEIALTSDYGTSKFSIHANYSDTLGASGESEAYESGAKVGTETLSTPFGNKQVEHWRVTNTTDQATTVTDLYVGAKSPAIYMTVIAMTGTSDSIFDGTTTTVLSDTNIDAIKNGNV